MTIHNARLLGQVESAIHAGEMDADQAIHYMIAHSEVDADSLDEIRQRIHRTIADKETP